MKIAMLGAGAWGTALAISLAARHQIVLWARDATQVSVMETARANQRYLADIPFPSNLSLTADLDAALAEAELIILAVPVSGFRPMLKYLAGLPRNPPVIWL